MLYQELIPLTALLQGQTDFPGLACPGRRPREHQQVGEVGCSPLRGSSAWKAVSSLLSGGAGGTSPEPKQGRTGVLVLSCHSRRPVSAPA